MRALLLYFLTQNCLKPGERKGRREKAAGRIDSEPTAESLKLKRQPPYSWWAGEQRTNDAPFRTNNFTINQEVRRRKDNATCGANEARQEELRKNNSHKLCDAIQLSDSKFCCFVPPFPTKKNPRTQHTHTMETLRIAALLQPLSNFEWEEKVLEKRNEA